MRRTAGCGWDVFSLQPSEFAKPVLVLFLAWFLQDHMHVMDDWRKAVLPAVLPMLLLVALILKEPDLGTALVCLAVSAILLYLARMPWKYYAIGAIAAAPVLYYMLFRVGWRVGADAHLHASGRRIRAAPAFTSCSH